MGICCHLWFWLCTQSDLWEYVVVYGFGCVLNPRCVDLCEYVTIYGVVCANMLLSMVLALCRTQQLPGKVRRSMGRCYIYGVVRAHISSPTLCVVRKRERCVDLWEYVVVYGFGCVLNPCCVDLCEYVTIYGVVCANMLLSMVLALCRTPCFQPTGKVRRSMGRCYYLWCYPC